MALARDEQQEEEDYGERFVDFWTSRQPEQGQKGSSDFPLWDYPNPVMDKRCNHDLLDVQKDLLLEDYPCDHAHNKLMQFPQSLDTWTPSYSEDVFAQEYLLAAQNLKAQQQPSAPVAEERTGRAGATLSGLQGAHQESNCSSDCHVLVNTICNLSKVLLSHYSSPPSAAARELQLAVFNLSRCLLRAHGTEDAQVEASAVSENKCRSPEDDEKESDSSGLDEAEDDIVARLEVLMGLEEDGRARKESDNICMDLTKQQEEGSYLELNQVEQRLAILGSRPALETEAGGAIISGKQIDEEYIRQNADQVIDREAVLFELEDPAAPAAAAAAASVEKVLRSDSSEESWEHV